MSLGTLFVDEQPLPIAVIYLENGQIIFKTEKIHGPLTIPNDSEVRIHDPHGGLVMVAPWRDGAVHLENLDWDATFFLPVEISETVGWPRPVRANRPA